MTVALPAPAPSPRRRRLSAWQRLLADRAVLLGVLVLLLVVVSALGARWIAPHNPNAQDVSRRLLPPLSPGHILGSDELGRDILARIVYGSRVSLIVGFVSVAIAGTIGVLFGLVSGYSRSAVTIVIDWLTNVQLAFPFILLAIAVVAVTGSGLRNLVIVLGVTSWPVYTRITRGTVMGLREREFVEASRATGGSTVHILLRHVLPNTLAPLLVIATFEVARLIVAEAALSFLGLGVQPNTPSWGSMLADGRGYLDTAWWLATFPGVAIVLVVLGINLIGDWLRDEFDYRL